MRFITTIAASDIGIVIATAKVLLLLLWDKSEQL